MVEPYDSIGTAMISCRHAGAEGTTTDTRFDSWIDGTESRWLHFYGTEADFTGSVRTLRISL